MSESNTAVDSPAAAVAVFSASDNVNRARNSEPGKMAVNLNMQFVDYAWRFATVPGTGDRAAHVAEYRAWRSANLRSKRNPRPAGPSGAGDGQANFSMGRRERAILRRPAKCRARPASGHSLRHPAGPLDRIRTAGCSACSAKSTSPSLFPTTWTGWESATSTW